MMMSKFECKHRFAIEIVLDDDEGVGDHTEFVEYQRCIDCDRRVKVSQGTVGGSTLVRHAVSAGYFNELQHNYCEGCYNEVNVVVEDVRGDEFCKLCEGVCDDCGVVSSTKLYRNENSGDVRVCKRCELSLVTCSGCSDELLSGGVKVYKGLKYCRVCYVDAVDPVVTLSGLRKSEVDDYCDGVRKGERGE